MPIMTELQIVEILKMHPQQSVIIEKPFLLNVSEFMMNNNEKFDKVSINQEEKDIKRKLSDIMTVLENQV